MKDSQKPDHVSLANMVGRLRERRHVIPDFQRAFEWQPWDIKELMSSIFRYPLCRMASSGQRTL